MTSAIQPRDDYDYDNETQHRLGVDRELAQTHRRGQDLELGFGEGGANSLIFSSVQGFRVAMGLNAENQFVLTSVDSGDNVDEFVLYQNIAGAPQSLGDLDQAAQQQIVSLAIDGDGRDALIEQLALAGTGRDTAIAGLETFLQASVGDLSAQITAEQQARADGDLAQAQALNVVRAVGSLEHLVRNGNFSGSDLGPGVPVGWNDWVGGDTGEIVQSDSNNPDSRALRFVVTEVSQSLGIRQTVEVTGGSQYELEVDMTSVAGGSSGSGVLVQWRQADRTFVSQVGLNFRGADTERRSGDVPGQRAFYAGFEAPPNAALAQIHLMANFLGFGSGGSVKTIDFRRISFRQISGGGAELVELREAVFEPDGALARLSIGAAVPGADAAIVVEAQNENGDAFSTIAMVADRFFLFNGTAALPALSVVAGNVQVSGSLAAGSGVFFGNGAGRWPVALEPRRYALLDGQSVSYGVEFPVPADISFDTSNLPAVAEGQSYAIRPINSTGSGFTLEALRLTDAGTVTRAGNVDADGSAQGFDRIMNAFHSGEASDGNYTFDLTVLINTVASGFAGGFGDTRLRFYFHNGAGWVLGDEIGAFASSPSGGLVAARNDYTIQYSGALRNSGPAFAVEVVSNDSSERVTDIHRVSYQTSAASGQSSATIGGQRVIALVQPRNA